jgi:hypothetical protein
MVSRYLLRNHDDPGRQSRTSDARNSEQLSKARYVCGSTENGELLHQLPVYVVEIARSLQLAVSKTLERGISILVASFFHQPTRAFFTETSSIPVGTRSTMAERAYQDKSKHRSREEWQAGTQNRAAVSRLWFPLCIGQDWRRIRGRCRTRSDKKNVTINSSVL